MTHVTPGQHTRLAVGARTHVGLERTENQDCMSRGQTSFGDVFIVADGMGGYHGGARAAELTVETLKTVLEALAPSQDLAAGLRDAFIAANDRVRRERTADPTLGGMGSTALVVMTRGTRAIISHVGDTRAYLYRGAKLRLLTKDHTEVQRMLDARMINELEAKRHPQVGELTRAVGAHPDIDPEIGDWLTLRTGDQLLLCTDGLSAFVEEPDIIGVLQQESTPQEKADAFIRLALSKGGHDNITVQVIFLTRTNTAHSSRGVPIAVTLIACMLVTIATNLLLWQYSERLRGWLAPAAPVPDMAGAALSQANAALQSIERLQTEIDAIKGQLERNSTESNTPVSSAGSAAPPTVQQSVEQPRKPKRPRVRTSHPGDKAPSPPENAQDQPAPPVAGPVGSAESAEPQPQPANSPGPSDSNETSGGTTTFGEEPQGPATPPQQDTPVPRVE
jgi:PPM family protein phosphatase